jgi:hypothetical protein
MHVVGNELFPVVRRADRVETERIITFRLFCAKAPVWCVLAYCLQSVDNPLFYYTKLY